MRLGNEMIKGYIDAIILSILEHEDSYGYEITKSVYVQTEGQMELKEGTLYPSLKRLEAHGNIEGYWLDKDSGPRRRYYRITLKGRGKLKEYRQAWSDQERIISQFLRGGLHASDLRVVE
jgi:DNA-binding PadR family transcriptional regulator